MTLSSSRVRDSSNHGSERSHSKLQRRNRTIVKRSTCSTVYCQAGWWAYGINSMPGYRAITSTLSAFARGTRIAIRPLWSPMQDSEVHKISKRDTGGIRNPITSSNTCAAISIGSCPICNRTVWRTLQKRDLRPTRDVPDRIKYPSRALSPENDPADHEQAPSKRSL